MSYKQEGIIFNPDKKEPVVDKLNAVNLSLEDFIKQKRASKKTADSKSSNRSKKQTTVKKTRTSRKISKKPSRQEKRESKKDSQTKTPSKKNIEIKVPESTLHEILNNVGVDTEGYNLRLVASKRK